MADIFIDNGFVINLVTRKDRLTSIQKSYCLDIPLYRINALGLDSYEKLKPFFIDKNLNIISKSFFSKTVALSYMSHIKCLETIIEKNSQNSIIFEDDVVFTQDFSDKFEEYLLNCPKDFDILILGHDNSIKEKRSFLLDKLANNVKSENRKSFQIDEYFSIPDFFTGMHCYIVSLKGAKKIRDLFYRDKISGFFDMAICNWVSKNELSGYITNESLISQNVYFTSDVINNEFPILVNNIFSKLFCKEETMFFNKPLLEKGNCRITYFSCILFLVFSILFQFPVDGSLMKKSIVIFFILDLVSGSFVNSVFHMSILLFFEKILKKE